MKTFSLLAAVALAFVVAAPAEADQHVFPNHGQSRSQQRRDEDRCHAWAYKKTGFDPARPPPATASAAPVTGSGSRLIGAGAGAAVAGIAGGNAGTGAIVGAVGGGLARRVRNRNAADRQNDANRQEWENARASYFRARAACLEGKGYTVR
jgi:hypothetical protein